MTPAHLARLAATAALTALVAGAAGAQTPRRDSLTLYEGADYRGASVTLYGDLADIGSTGFADRARSAQVIGQWRVCAGGGFRNGCKTVQGNIRDLSVLGLSAVGSAQKLSSAEAPRYAPRYQPPRAAAPAPLSIAPPITRPAPAPQSRPAPPVRAEIAPPRELPPPATPYTPGYAPPYEPGYSDARPGYADGFYDPGPPAVDAPAPAFRAPPVERLAPTPLQAPPPSLQAPFDAPPSGGVDGMGATFFPRPVRNGYDLSASGIGAADAFCRAQGLGVAVYFDSTQRAPSALDERGQPTGPGPVLRDVLCRRF